MGHSVTLQWTTGANLSVTFNVYRSQVSNVFQQPLNQTPILPGLVGVFTKFTDTTVTAGTWFYVVTAVSVDGESAFSSQVSVTISPTAVPPAISGLSVLGSS